MKKTRSGFTLVELALSMAFIGILSVAVVLIIANTVAAYRRGLTLSQVNTTGMDIVDDMRWAVGNSSSRSASTDCYRFYKETSGGQLAACTNDGAYSFVTIVKTANVKIPNGPGGSMKDLGETPIYGAFCTGTYSYIWNSGYFEVEGAKIDGMENSNKWAKLKYRTGPHDSDVVTIEHTLREGKDSDKKPFRLLKIRDDYRSVCASVSLPNPKDPSRSYVRSSDIKNAIANGNILTDNTFNIVNYRVLDEEPVDLVLADVENDLALFDLYVAKPAESTTQKNMLYAVSFILGTIGGGADITAKGNSCAPPSNYTIENFDYCAINKFNFAMQANGEL